MISGQSFSGRRPVEARAANNAAVLTLLARSGPLSHGEIVAAIGLSQGSVSRIVGELIDTGVVREADRKPTGRGRPKAFVDLDPDSRAAVGVHIGVERITVALTDLRGDQLEQVVQSRRSADPAETIEHVAALAGEIADRATVPVIGIGLATAGQVDRASGIIVDSTMFGWHKVSAGALLANASGRRVVVESNTRAQLCAEMTFADEGNINSVMFLFLGNVAELAVIGARAVEPAVSGSIGGVLVPSLTDPSRYLPMETASTDRAVVEAAQAVGAEVASVQDVVAVATQDSAVRRVLEARCDQIAHVLDVTAGLTRPDRIILGGSAAPDEHWLDRLRTRSRPSGPWAPEALQRAERSMASAAASVVLREFFLHGGDASDDDGGTPA